jgi:hypothetical protein
MADMDLQTALGMFVQGTKDLALSNALNKANEQVQQIKMSGIKDTDQRMQLGQIAQGLVGQMAGLGANASQVEQARLAFTPKTYASADQAMLDARLNGDMGLAKAASEADEMSQASNIKLASAREKIAERSQSRLFQQQENMSDKKFAQQEALMKMKQEYMQKSLSDQEINKLQAIDQSTIALKDLIGQVKDNEGLVGPVASRIPGRDLFDSDFAVFKQGAEQMFNQYRKDITGAGASDKEQEMLRRAQPNIKDTPKVFQAKAKKLMEMGEQIKQKYLSNLQKSGREVSGFATDMKPAEAVKKAANNPANYLE